VLAIISGAEDFIEINDHASTKRKWLKSFLVLPAGIPSHDTFNRVLCAIDSNEFEQCFVSWISDYPGQLPIQEEDRDIIPIDGKTICNSGDQRKGNKAIHMVSALSVKSGLILGQRKCNEKSNEITAIPLLLKWFYETQSWSNLKSIANDCKQVSNNLYLSHSFLSDSP